MSLVAIQKPVQSRVHNMLLAPPLQSFQSQEETLVQVSFLRYPPPG